VFLGYVPLVLCKVFITIDGDDLDAGHLVLKGLQAGHFFDAGGAPTGPKVQDNHFALKTLQVNSVLAVIDGKYWSFEADLVGKRASIAAGGQGAEY